VEIEQDGSPSQLITGQRYPAIHRYEPLIM